ncbi:Aldehyde dehydrogenase domain [Trinorchestia longiramus]|nr:Aldehyde dehydrogenase domain [Trinorchestia longiramus]
MTTLKTEAFIGGQWVGGDSTFSVTNPYNGELLANVKDCSASDALQAVESAGRAFETWRTATVPEKVSALLKIKEELLARKDELALIITKENGKPLAEAKGEVAFAASFFQWFAEEARRSYGDVIPSPSGNKRLSTLRQPIGVVALITPWNFPLAMLARKIAPALAAGCTCVVKPAEDTPLIALAFAQVVENTGLLPGVVNVIPCSRRNAQEVGSALCSSKEVRLLAFTGSTAVGKLLYAQCGGSLKRLAMELGGNAPFIVFPSADLSKAIEGAMTSKFRNTGQACVASNRFIIHSSMVDKFVDALKKRMSDTLVLGDGLQDGVNLGPLINESQFQRLKEIVSRSVEKGAKVVCGGKPGKFSFLYEPTILTDVTPGMPAFDEEIFGPVVSITIFSREDEAVALANKSEHGLAGFFYTEDLGQAVRVAERLEVGMVGVNESLVSTCEAPFGGVKMSGFGKEGSRHGLDDYTELKYICLGL